MEIILEICAKMLFQNIFRNVYKIGKNYDKGEKVNIYLIDFIFDLWWGFLNKTLIDYFCFVFVFIVSPECDCGCLDSYNSSSAASSSAIVVAGNSGTGNFNNGSANNKTNNESSAIGVGVSGGNEISVGVISSSTNVASSVAIVPSNGIKTAHTKVATSGGHANTQPPSKRSSSGADGDYQLVQHEVLYSLSAEYEVSLFWLIKHKNLNYIYLLFCF